MDSKQEGFGPAAKKKRRFLHDEDVELLKKITFSTLAHVAYQRRHESALF